MVCAIILYYHDVSCFGFLKVVFSVLPIKTCFIFYFSPFQTNFPLSELFHYWKKPFVSLHAGNLFRRVMLGAKF